MKRTLLAAALMIAAGATQAATTELVLYKADNFRGPAQTIKGEVNNLEGGFGHEASSMIARGGAWQVCTGDHFSGRCKVVREGQYPTLGWLNDRIVSVKFLGQGQDFARYDNWEAKREARNDRPDWRDGQESRGPQDFRDRQDLRGRQDANGYGEPQSQPPRYNPDSERDRNYRR